MQIAPITVPVIRSIAMCVGCCVTIMSCGGRSDGDALPEDVLAKVGTEVLTVADVREVLPYSLTGTDSAAWCRSYVDAWVERKVIGVEAAREIADTRRIDRMAEDYRNDLLMREYRRQMAGQNSSVEFDEDTLRAEYDRNRGMYRCTQPMMRGIFLAVDARHPRLHDLRRWSRSTRADDLERLEKESLDPDIEYLYFRDRWLSWTDIAGRVAGGIDADPDKLLKRHPGFETKVGDRVYMLSVSDYLAPGEPMPFDLAREAVSRMLASESAAAYDRTLRDGLVSRACANGLVRINRTLIPGADTDSVAVDN